MMLDKQRPMLGQVQDIFKSQLHVVTRQNIVHQIGGRDTTRWHDGILGCAAFGSQFHGKSTAIQAADFLFFVRSQKVDTLRS